MRFIECLRASAGIVDSLQLSRIQPSRDCQGAVARIAEPVWFRLCRVRERWFKGRSEWWDWMATYDRSLQDVGATAPSRSRLGKGAPESTTRLPSHDREGVVVLCPRA